MEGGEDRDVKARIKTRCIHAVADKVHPGTNTEPIRLSLNLMPKRSIPHHYEVHIIR